MNNEKGIVHTVQIGPDELSFSVVKDSRDRIKSIMHGKIITEACISHQAFQAMLEICFRLIGILLKQDRDNIDKIIKIMEYDRFEPSGFTDNDNIRNCSSIVDYIAKYLKAIEKENK